MCGVPFVFNGLLKVIILKESQVKLQCGRAVIRPPSLTEA